MPERPMHGSVTVVTGGARGIGRAIALRLATLGARVCIVDRNLDAAREFNEQLGAESVEAELRELGDDALALEADLSAPDSGRVVIDEVLARWDTLNVLVTVAGGATVPFEQSAASNLSDEILSAVIDANLRTTIGCCTAAIEPMRAAGGGSIVTIGSSAGSVVAMPDGHVAAYGLSKAAVHHYTRYLANEVGKWGIRVNCVAPGSIRTARVLAQSGNTGLITNDSAKAIPLRREGTPDDIADAVQFLTSPLSSYITGQVLAVNGGVI